MNTIKDETKAKQVYLNIVGECIPHGQNGKRRSLSSCPTAPLTTITLVSDTQVLYCSRSTLQLQSAINEPTTPSNILRS